MKCPRCNGSRMAAYMGSADWFAADSEPFEPGKVERLEDDELETCVSVGVLHCLDCEYEEFWLEDPRSPLEAEVERLRGAILAIRARVAHIQGQGRITIPAALWMLDTLDAALEPQP